MGQTQAASSPAVVSTPQTPSWALNTLHERLFPTVRSGDPRCCRHLCAEEAARPACGRGRGWGRRCGRRAVWLLTGLACRASPRGPRRCSQETWGHSGTQPTPGLSHESLPLGAATPRWPTGCCLKIQADLCPGPLLQPSGSQNEALCCQNHSFWPRFRPSEPEAGLRACRGLLQYLCPECSSSRYPGQLPFPPPCILPDPTSQQGRS